MTQKEKAKAYDEALERAKKCLDENRDTCFVRPDVIFPELADKDERIRKTLIEYFNTCFGDYYGELKKSDILAWLEKQGEKKPVIEMITPEESLGIESETYNEIVNACIFGENKPKFKVGDWIYHNNGYRGPYLITNINEHGVELDNNIRIKIEDCYDYHHLWTIQDAKKGDVLAIDPWSDYPSSFVSIYKKQNEEDFGDFDSYCFVGFDGKFYEGEDGHSVEDIHPATKEQRDLLFQKMKEAGYEWDAENLQLTKILHVKELSDGINIDKQKLAEWSEEDNWIKTKIIKVLLGCETFLTSEETNECIDWIKSIKQRLKGKS